MRLYNYAYRMRIVVAFMALLMLFVSSAGAVNFLDKFKKKTESTISVDQASKVDLSVKGLSCSSCISQIKGALSDTDGVVDTIVDLSTNTAKVYYNPAKIVDPKIIADKITAIGYPATVVKVYSVKEIQKQEEISAQKSKIYIASVGDYDIARNDYEIELASLKKRYEKSYPGVFASARGAQLERSLKSQVASKLIREGVMLQEVLKANYQVEDTLVEKELKAMLKNANKTKKQFLSELEENGVPYEYVRKQFVNQMMINKYLEEKVFASSTTQYDRQKSYQDWYGNASALAPVIYYDKELIANNKQQSGGASCCPAN